MTFGNFNNARNEGRSYNTRFYPSYTDQSLLTVGGWDQAITIKIFPALRKNEKGLTEYDQEQGHFANFTIKLENAEILSNGIKNDILPAYQKKESASIGVTSVTTAGVRKIFQVITENGELKCRIISETDANGVAAEEKVITHTFKEREYLKNYDYHSGNHDLKTYPADFYVFAECIFRAGNLLQDIAHSIGYHNLIRSSFKGDRHYGAAKKEGGEEFSANVNTFEGTDASEFLPFK